MTERILVVPKQTLFSEKYFQGFLQKKEYDFLPLIQKHGFFTERTRELENNLGLKQIVTYQVFTFNGKIFLYKRIIPTIEKRHLGNFSLGIGGHVSAENEKPVDVLEAGRKKEFEEETDYAGKYEAKLIGFINLEEGVNAVHFGLVYILSGSSPEIRMKEKYNLEMGLFELSELKEYHEKMEDWSKLIFNGAKDVLGR